MKAYCMVPLLAQGPDESNIPDIISIILVDGPEDKRIRISFPLIHPTTLSAWTDFNKSRIAYNRGACILSNRPCLAEV
jgi:hypothetical protein